MNVPTSILKLEAVRSRAVELAMAAICPPNYKFYVTKVSIAVIHKNDKISTKQMDKISIS